jgi:hypothetical protein
MSKSKLTLTTWETICEFKKIDPAALPVVHHLPEEDQLYLIGCYKLPKIIAALNEQFHGKPWLPDYTNMNESKFEPAFEIKASKEIPSGFGFSGSRCDDWGASSSCGSRLAAVDREVIYFAQKHFEQVFKDVWIIKT